MRRCIYSAITGNYDSVKEIGCKNPDYDYIMFTNNRSVKSNTWTVVYLENPFELDDVRLARSVKLEYYKYISDYDFSVWVDGSILIHGDIANFIRTLAIKTTDFFISQHPHRDNIDDEAQACIVRNKDSTFKIEQQIAAYRVDGFKDNGIFAESGIIVRNHTLTVEKFCRAWFSHILEYSNRDQISFPYVMWTHPMKVCLFNTFRDNYLDVFRIEKHA